MRENEDQLRSPAMLSKLQRGECNDFWKEIKALNPEKESLNNIANLWKDHFSAIENSVGSTTSNQDQVMGLV